MDKSSTSIDLNFYVIGDDPGHCTIVTVHPHTPIAKLKADFIKEYKEGGYGELQRPIFYQVDRLPDDLSIHEDDQKLGGFGREVRDCWPEADQINKNFVHVIVLAQAPVPPIATKETVPQAIAEPEDQISEVAANIVQLRLDFFSGLSDNSSSQAAKPKAFRHQQSTINHILNGRPAHRTGPPVVLYHSVFGNFLRNLESPGPPPAEHIESLYEQTVTYLQSSQDQYVDEATRRLGRDDSSRPLLGPLVGGLLLRTTEVGTKPDGTATTSDGAWCIIMEMKNEIGSGESDPSIQAAQSYSRLWKSLPGFAKQCCCPSILIAIAGPWMSILGAILLDRPVVQPLTDFHWAGLNPSKPSNVDRLARLFYSLCEARRELEKYYANLPNPHQAPASSFPYPTRYFDSTGNWVEFEYKKHVNRTGTSSGKKELVFFARTLEAHPKRIVVKFVSRYHSDAHRLLAKEGLAPELLYDGAMHPENQPGPEHRMIVIEYMDGGDLGKSTIYPLPLSVPRDVERAIELLHAQDLVFGDLRRPNIMLVKNVKGKVTGAKLIDFDWCGKHLVERYPSSMNGGIIWADGMRPRGLLHKDHDIEMFRRLGL